MAGVIFRPTPSISRVSCEIGGGGLCSTSSCHGGGSQLSLAPVYRSRVAICPPPQHRGLKISPKSRLRCRSGLSLVSSWFGHSHLRDVVWTTVWHGKQWQTRRDIAGRVRASLLGVGAPEFLVIAVVALIVFGPRGLAEVARTLGKSLKAFQPTIQELQQVSREFKNTLEQEIGLDDFRGKNSVDLPQTYQRPPPQEVQSRGQNGSPDSKAYSTEDYVRIVEEQTKALVPENLEREAEAVAWGKSPTDSPAESSTNGDTNEAKRPEEEAG